VWLKIIEMPWGERQRRMREREREREREIFDERDMLGDACFFTILFAFF
jgi:hypothetical protein